MHWGTWRRVWGLLGVFWLLLCAGASAQATTSAGDSVPSDHDREARFLFEAGRTAYDAGRYQESLDHFQRAYELSQRAALLYNVGQAADRLRKDELALDAFERYLAALPEADNRPAVEERIRVLRQVLQEKQAAAAAAAQQAPSPQQTALAATPTATGPAATTASSAPARDDDGNLLSQWWVWAAAGGIVGGAIIVALVASSAGGPDKQGALVQGSNGKVIMALSRDARP